MQLFPTSQNRLPPGITCIEVPSKGGIKLRAAYIVPPNPKGTIFILNGRGDYIERYFETMNDLMARGFAVATFDWRGQGGSQRLLPEALRGYVKSFEDYDADIDAFFARVAIAHCPKPFYGLAHSMGGHNLLRALRGRKWLEKAVIIAPMLGFHFGRWPLWLVHVLTIGAKYTGLGWLFLPGLPKRALKRDEFKDNVLTSDRMRWDRDISTLEEHPQLGLGAPTFTWLRAALKSLDDLFHWPKAVGPSCPTMIVLAGQDRVVNNADCHNFLKHAPGFSVITIADSEHEILHEKNDIRQKFFAAFEAFIAG
jgi:lysophospholipase